MTTPAVAMRVESVTVVALHRPEDGGLLLRVLPNVVARRETAIPTDTVQVEAEEPPLEPACSALVSRLKARPLVQEADCLGSVCVICAEELSELGTPIVDLICGHAFHEGCIRQWLARRHTCPTCRLELEVNDVRYLRSIGLVDEANALEKVEQEKQEAELQKQAAARRRWVDSMRCGDPVHFGLVCGKCSVTPLIGDCYRCALCDGYMLCSDCFAAREACLSASAGTGSEASIEDDHPEGHLFMPFSPSGGANGLDGVPTGPGGLLTVLVRPPATQQQSGTGDESPNDAALAAAEVAFAAVRSLALAPLTAAPPSMANGGGPSAAASGANLSHGAASRRASGGR